MSELGELEWNRGSEEVILSKAREQYHKTLEEAWVTANINMASVYITLYGRYEGKKDLRSRLRRAKHGWRGIVHSRRVRGQVIHDPAKASVVGKALGYAPAPFGDLGGAIILVSKCLDYNKKRSDAVPHDIALLHVLMADLIRLRTIKEKGWMDEQWGNIIFHLDSALNLESAVMLEDNGLMAKRQFVRVLKTAGRLLYDLNQKESTEATRGKILLGRALRMADGIALDQYDKITAILRERNLSVEDL
jgi:hypothetical protein